MLALVLLLFVSVAIPTGTAPAAEVELPSSNEIQEQFPEGGKLSGHELYQRFLQNRFTSSLQRLTVISRDPGGSEQKMQLLARWKDFRGEGVPDDGVIAKTWVQLEEPYDLWRTTYLLVVRRGKPHEQFLYQPSERRVRRIWLRGIGLLGTDYTLDDLVFQTVEDATYERLPDQDVEGMPTYVVKARMKSFLDSQYEWVTVFLDQEHYVMLRALYQDDDGVLVRELRADVASLDEFEGVWLATRSTMHNVREGTTSTLIVHHLLPNAELDDRLFSSFRMGTGAN